MTALSYLWSPQAAVGQSLLSSTVEDLPYIRRIYIARLAGEIMRARGWTNYDHAAAVAARYVRRYGMPKKVGR